MVAPDPAAVEAVARALDRNHVMDVPDGTVGPYMGWPENDKADLRAIACKAIAAYEAWKIQEKK